MWDIRNYVLLVLALVMGTATVAVPETWPSWVGPAAVVIAIVAALAYKLSPDNEPPYGVPDWIRNERLAAALERLAAQTDGDPGQALLDLIDRWVERPDDASSEDSEP